MICGRCGQDKSVEDFSNSEKERQKKQFYCKSCNREYCKRHYHKNKARYRENRIRLVKEIREMITAAKAVPCSDCKKKYPSCVMDFDHVKGNKAFNIGASCRSGSKKAVLTEMAKCEVVCSNCHRIRTRDRGYGVVA